MINIFFGGTLKDVDRQYGVQSLKWTNSSHHKQFPMIMRLQKFIYKKFVSESMHGQAADRVGKGLHVVLKKGEIPKLLISNNGNFIGSQVHPESYIYIYGAPLTAFLKVGIIKSFFLFQTNKALYEFFMNKVVKYHDTPYQS